MRLRPLPLPDSSITLPENVLWPIRLGEVIEAGREVKVGDTVWYKGGGDSEDDILLEGDCLEYASYGYRTKRR